MTSADRAAALGGLARAEALQFADFSRALGNAFAAGLVSLTGDAGRDIVALTAAFTDESKFCEYQGAAANGELRFLGAAHEAEACVIELFVVATKAPRVADWSAFGQSGADFGNSVLVARAFDITVETAIVHGVSAIVNHPIDARVRRIYTEMGFDNGERLDLLQPTSIARACAYIEGAYAVAAQHRGFRRPW